MLYLTLLIGLLILAIYLYGTRNFDYWKKKGVTYEKPIPFIGSNLKQVFENVSFTERFVNFYRRYPNDKYVGFFEGNRPALMVRDPEIIKRILVTDFRYFHLRGVNPSKTVVEPIFRNLFTGDGDVWKLMRQKLTPAFSSGKLKAMFPIIVENAEKLLSIVDKRAEVGDEVDVRELMARYATDFIGTCGFGIDSDSLNDEDSDFRRLGKRIVTTTLRDALILLLKRSAPETFRHLHFFAPEIERNTVSIVKQIMAQRNFKPSGRNDFIDMLLELKLKGNISGESVEKINPDGTPVIVEFEFTDMLLAAQVFIFFVAGFETSSSTSSFMLHSLAYHPEEQVRCQQEVDRTLAKYDGKICYDAVKEMKYLECVLRESIRILPSLGFLLRKSAKSYTFPGTDLTIDSDMGIFIPIHALQNDEKYFDKPDQFRPDRFLPDNINKIDKNVFMPFGDGPRACIGERLGIMQSIAGVAMVLSKFSVLPSRNSIRKPLIDPTSVIVTNVKGGLPLTLKRRQQYNK